MPTMMQNGFDRVRKAAKGAVDSVVKLAGKSSDKDVIFYDSLKEDDFITMTEEYGADETMRYVAEMERRKAAGGR